jgi:two-component system CheB/CheR fusion protein
VQIERRLDRSQGGLGIGLSLAKNLVQMHGGNLSAHSEGPGKGSEFVVRLPATAADRCDSCGPAHRPPARAAHGPRASRILVVDDNRDAADSLARYLTRVMGQRVEVAYDGPGAVDVARRFRPDVVLLDIGLPGMSGYEVAERLRSGPETGGALLIALTGWGQEEDRRRSKEAGIDFHLVKPVDLDAVQNLLLKAEPT